MLKKIGRPVGRPRGSISKRRQMAQEVMNQLEVELGRQVNPLEALLRTGADTTQSLSIRVECWTQALPYLYPKLQSRSLAVTTREDDGPELACLEMERILSTPEGVEAAQRMALLLVPAPAPAQICEPDQALPAPARDPIEDLERQPNGHWAKR